MTSFIIFVILVIIGCLGYVGFIFFKDMYDDIIMLEKRVTAQNGAMGRLLGRMDELEKKVRAMQVAK